MAARWYGRFRPLVESGYEFADNQGAMRANVRSFGQRMYQELSFTYESKLFVGECDLDSETISCDRELVSNSRRPMPAGEKQDDSQGNPGRESGHDNAAA